MERALSLSPMNQNWRNFQAQKKAHCTHGRLSANVQLELKLIEKCNNETSFVYRMHLQCAIAGELRCRWKSFLKIKNELRRWRKRWQFCLFFSFFSSLFFSFKMEMQFEATNCVSETNGSARRRFDGDKHRVTVVRQTSWCDKLQTMNFVWCPSQHQWKFHWMDKPPRTGFVFLFLFLFQLTANGIIFLVHIFRHSDATGRLFSISLRGRNRLHRASHPFNVAHYTMSFRAHSPTVAWHNRNGRNLWRCCRWKIGISSIHFGMFIVPQFDPNAKSKAVYRSSFGDACVLSPTEAITRK